jgi:hypothetical protein
MVFFNKIQISVKYLEKCIQNQKKIDFNSFFLKNKESNLFGQTFIFRRGSGRTHRNLFGYGSILNKNSLFSQLLNKGNNLSLFLKYFKIKKNFKIYEKKKEFQLFELLSFLYQNNNVFPKKKKQINFYEYNLDIKKTPYFYLKDDFENTQKNYKILSRTCIHDFFNLDKSIKKTNE